MKTVRILAFLIEERKFSPLLVLESKSKPETNVTIIVFVASTTAYI